MYTNIDINLQKSLAFICMLKIDFIPPFLIDIAKILQTRYSEYFATKNDGISL